MVIPNDEQRSSVWRLVASASVKRSDFAERQCQILLERLLITGYSSFC
jgi:hypothetical protein